MLHDGGLSKNKNATKVLSKKIFVAIGEKMFATNYTNGHE
jgi:hypothetical protein